MDRSEQARLCIQSSHSSSSTDRPHAEPIELSGVWQVDSPDEADRLLSGEQSGYVYRRDGHPNADSLSQVLGKLHEADEAIMTAQGMSALAAVALAVLKPGDSVLLGQPIYGRGNVLFAQEMARWNIETHNVDACDLKQWEAAMQHQPRLALVETITNPRIEVPDLSAIADIVHTGETLLLVDNTFATPLLCRPLNFGADLVMESLSKFVCGHADAMLGLLCGTSAAWSRIVATVSTFGLASSPLDCWLTRRGLTTLDVRLQRACENALALATAIENHPAISKIDFPGLASHPHHAVAERQFDGRFGNMLTLHLQGDSNVTPRFVTSLGSDVPFCPSLGEAQTTLSHPCSTSHRSYSSDQLSHLGISPNTVRISVGIEQTDWLVERFVAALNTLG